MNINILIVCIVQIIIIGISIIHNLPNYVTIPLIVLEIAFIFALFFSYEIVVGSKSLLDGKKETTTSTTNASNASNTSTATSS